MVRCDNYSVCGGDMPLAVSEDSARAKGWHIFHGTTIGGAPADGVLCPDCAKSSRTQGRRLGVPPAGMEPLFEVVDPRPQGINAL